MTAKTVGIRDTKGVQYCIENTPSCEDCERYIDRCSDVLVDNLLESVPDGRILVETLAMTLVKAYIAHFGACTPEEDMEGILGVTRLIADVHMDDIDETYDQDWLDFGILPENYLPEREPIELLPDEDPFEICPYCGRYDFKRFGDLPTPESFVGIVDGATAELSADGHGRRITITFDTISDDLIPVQSEWDECMDEFIECLRASVLGRLHDAAGSEPVDGHCHVDDRRDLCDRPVVSHDCDPELCGGCCNGCAFADGVRRYRYGPDGKIHVVDHRGVLDGQ